MTWHPSNIKRKKLTRLWKGKHRKTLNTNFYVFDVETAHKKKGFNYWCLRATPSNFVFGVIYGHNYTRIIYTVEDFKKTLLEPRFKKAKLFAHNAQYDLNTLYGNIYDLDPEAIFNNKFICATNGNCLFADSSNIFVGLSVEAIGKMMKLHKGKLGGQKYRSKGITKNDINYCIRDCQIVWEALFTVFEFAGGVKITQAGLSLLYYKNFHQPFHIDYNSNVKHFWSSYYGGRTEAFKLGKTHGSVIDVNSMYPHNMKIGKFPNPKYLKHEIDFPVKKLKEYLNWFEGCAQMEVIHHEHDFGFLPTKSDGKLKFPVGNLKGCWNFPEIRLALKHNIITIKKVNSITYAEPLDSPFVSFVDTLNTIKEVASVNGNDWEKDRAKRLMNSLYGKFGQRIEEESIYINDMTKQLWLIQDYQRKNKFIRLVPFGRQRNDCFLVVTSKQKFCSHSIPSFASYVTSLGRVQLLEKILTLHPDNVLYCDTDSIFVKNIIGIETGNKLGEWKIENKIITEIKGLKNYKYIDDNKEIWRIKGVPKNKGRKVKIFKDDEVYEFDFVKQTGENSFKFFSLMKSKEALRRGLEPGILTERNKTIKNIYDKRTVLDNGETKPIKLT